MIKKHTYHAKGLLGFATLLFIVVGSGFTYAYFELATLERRYEAQLQLVANNELQARQAEQLQDTLDRSVEDRERLNSYFLNVREVADLLARTEQYMQQVGVLGEVGSIVPQPANDIGIATVALPYSVVGDRAQVMQVLRFMETLPYHSAVTDFALQGSANSSRVDAQFTVEVSYIEYDRN